MNGDTVQVDPGTYYENINFLGKAITVTSTAGPATTTINGGGLNAVVIIASGEGPNSVLNGFTITNGNASFAIPPSYYFGGGIYISGSPTITGNVITGNVASSGGGGIAAYFSSPLIESNTITNNTVIGGGADGAGVYVDGTGAAQLIGNTIGSNSCPYGSGGGIYLSTGSSSTTIEGNLIAGNSVSTEGGGIYMFADTNASIIQSTILAGASCTLRVTFMSTATGARSATMNFYDNGGGSPQTVSLSGTGT